MSGIQYLVSGSLAIIFSWFLSGCWLGTRHEDPPPPPPAIDGYYETAPANVTLCAFQTDDSKSKCVSDPSFTVPSATLRTIMSNPIGFLRESPYTTSALIFNPYTNQGSLKVSIDINTKQLSYQDISEESVFWRDPQCVTATLLTESGVLKQAESRYAGLGGFSVSGRLELNYNIIIAWMGDRPEETCAPTMQELQDCYENVDKCGGESPDENQALQRAVTGAFDQYIQGGAVGPGEIKNLVGISYEVSYH